MRLADGQIVAGIAPKPLRAGDHVELYPDLVLTMGEDVATGQILVVREGDTRLWSAKP